MARAKNSRHAQNAEPGGLWHQPALLNLLADLLIVLSIATLAWAALTTLQRLPLFPLRELVLTAAPGRVPPAQLEHAARTSIVGNFFTVDLDATRAAFEKLPWVRRASVRRQWPDGLALTLDEHEALAHWRRLDDGDEAGLVNRHGEIFVADLPDNAPALPRFSGPEGSAPELLRRHGEFAAALAGIGRRAASIALSPRLAWRVKLDDGTLLELGRNQERHPLDERMARFVAHYETAKTQAGTFRVADMRYPNGFALGGMATAPARQETRERKS
ncbi:MAG: cell division protein FtsQ/DivIB [Pseudomonadota bacterium]